MPERTTSSGINLMSLVCLNLSYTLKTYLIKHGSLLLWGALWLWLWESVGLLQERWASFGILDTWHVSKWSWQLVHDISVKSMLLQLSNSLPSVTTVTMGIQVYRCQRILPGNPSYWWASEFLQHTHSCKWSLCWMNMLAKNLTHPYCGGIVSWTGMARLSVKDPLDHSLRVSGHELHPASQRQLTLFVRRHAQDDGATC